jgi:hypothetical protein
MTAKSRCGGAAALISATVTLEAMSQPEAVRRSRYASFRVDLPEYLANIREKSIS